jgi:hypothetical protein
MRIAIACAAALLVASTSMAAGPAGEVGAQREPRAASRECGHAEALRAAKRALAEGNREGALSLLQRARSLVAACQQNATERDEESTTTPSAFATAPSGGAAFASF